MQNIFMQVESMPIDKNLDFVAIDEIKCVQIMNVVIYLLTDY